MNLTQLASLVGAVKTSRKRKLQQKKREKYELTLKDKRNKNIEKFQLRFWKIFEIITSTRTLNLHKSVENILQRSA